MNASHTALNAFSPFKVPYRLFGKKLRKLSAHWPPMLDDYKYSFSRLALPSQWATHCHYFSVRPGKSQLRHDYFCQRILRIGPSKSRLSLLQFHWTCQVSHSSGNNYPWSLKIPMQAWPAWHRLGSFGFSSKFGGGRLGFYHYCQNFGLPVRRHSFFVSSRQDSASISEGIHAASVLV